MKCLINKTLSIIYIFFSIVAMTGCELIDDAISECDEEQNQMKTEQRTFVLSADVKWKDGTPAENVRVKFKYKKQYCEGKINGEFEKLPDAKTDINGHVFSGWQRTYDYTNKKDVVIIEIFAGALTPTDFCIMGKMKHVYRWEDVDEDLDEHVLGFVNKTFAVMLEYNGSDNITDIICLDE